jgi:actinin alpha
LSLCCNIILIFDYSAFALQDITSKWNDVGHLVPQRDETLRLEKIRQLNNERLRREFAQKANTVGPWIEHRNDIVGCIGVQQGTLESKLQKLAGHEQELAQFARNIEELEKINQVCFTSIIWPSLNDMTDFHVTV